MFFEFRNINTPVYYLQEYFMTEKYGFVYIWCDKKHKRYYVGAHTKS